MSWQVVLGRQATKDAENLSRAGLAPQAKRLLAILQSDPYQSPPHFEKLRGRLTGFVSRRINRQHRLVYSIDAERRLVLVLRMWTHYE